MQITSFRIDGLFSRFNHHLQFPQVSDEDPRPSVVILYGANGVGKTTVLRMLNALLGDARQNRYEVFQKVPFSSCVLQISELSPFTITSIGGDEMIQIMFDGQVCQLPRLNARGDPRLLEHFRDSDGDVLNLRRAFVEATRDLSFDFIETARIDRHDAEAERRARDRTIAGHRYQGPLSERMARFISFAQLDSRAFFASAQPDLFSKIIERITTPRVELHSTELLLERLSEVRAQDLLTDRFGLEREEWDFGRLAQILSTLPNDTDLRENALAVTAQYVEFLETRAAERSLIAERLFTFERVMNEFFNGKRVTVLPREGLHIETDSGVVIDEHRLSSGEHHLLYLMVSAVSTRRRGTVIAIDEPEMSMHIAWQRKLIPALLECAAKAEPQFIFASHSPELSAEYPHALLELH